ncbi:hypothetical protein ABZ667_09405 [Streptomyces lavendulae]|uniref:hypothetical protein n=1 Tax=Streptomyces lavendulae TaxID=1914 RepID=UPI0033EA8B59
MREQPLGEIRAALGIDTAGLVAVHEASERFDLAAERHSGCPARRIDRVNGG